MSAAFIHPTAVVDAGAEIGDDTRVWHFVHVSSGARIGRGCSLGQNVFVGRGVRVGNGVKVQNNVSIYEGVEVDDDVFLGPSCVFTNVNNPRAFVERKTEFRGTRVHRGASIGANATIVCGHDVGAYSFVGAGAVVTKNVPPHALVVGNPARRIGWMSRAGERLPEGPRPLCPRTGEAYIVSDDACRVRSPADERDDGPIPAVDLAAEHEPLLPAFRAAFERIMSSGQFILGDEVASFERECAAILGVPHALGVSSGTDGLLLALMAMNIGPGDEVITTPFSFFATAGSIARVGATPVFVDIDPTSYCLDASRIASAITPRTRAIMPVHLFGRAGDVRALLAIAREHGLPVIEDAAQAIGARAGDGNVGTLGLAAAFSFFPSKNLGAFGDGGLVTTTDDALAARMRLMRHHGMSPKYHHTAIGGNFRLDALQAALLRVKLPHLTTWTEARRRNAEAYREAFEAAQLPPEVLRLPAPDVGHVWNQYVIRTPRRDELRKHLGVRGIASEVYYPLALHLQPALAYLGYREGSMPEAERATREVLAIPVFPELGSARLERVVREIVAFLRG